MSSNYPLSFLKSIMLELVYGYGISPKVVQNFLYDNQHKIGDLMEQAKTYKEETVPFELIEQACKRLTE